ncbi:GNAT family N-acetyltransferase [Agrococcus sp. DT81.2]|uniref:GNAT family N-acetyltransferase n=1 Tax=Agrococcus sp. DT81.2 TaxID=3393414 RepID=UPI003CE51C74
MATTSPERAAPLRGDLIRLRPVRARDLDELYERLGALEHRGAYFPVGLRAEPVFRRSFDETGFWGKDEGMLLMTSCDGAVVGEIEFYPIASYLTGFELSYLLFGREHHGKGYTTEAVRLLTAYLFSRWQIERVQLAIHPDNAASRRVAEKSGYALEGRMRRCWYNDGAFHDLEIWATLRSERPAASP